MISMKTGLNPRSQLIGMDVIEKVRENTRKITAAVVSVGLGASAAAGFALMDDSSEMKKSLDLANQDDDVSAVDSEIEESKQKLETVAASSDKEVKYTRLGC